MNSVIVVGASASPAGHAGLLGGANGPIDGPGVDHLLVAQMLSRLNDGIVTVMIVAATINLEGEATAGYSQASLSRGSRAACSSAATSSTPTRPRSAACSRGASTPNA